LAGRGKTEYIIQKAVTLAGQGEKSVILVPSVMLCEELFERIGREIEKRKLSVPINSKTVHHENCSGAVIGAIISHINREEYPEGEILIMTQAAYDLVPWSHFRLWVESGRMNPPPRKTWGAGLLGFASHCGLEPRISTLSNSVRKTPIDSLVDFRTESGRVKLTILPPRPPPSHTPTPVLYHSAQPRKGEYSRMSDALCGGSVFERKISKYPSEIVARDFSGFAEWLREKHRRNVSRKEFANLISPWLYDPTIECETKKGKKNIVESFANILLDNDTGAFSVGQFAALFPELQFIACNSFNTTAALPKYRLFIPTDLVMDIDTYELIAEYIIARIAESCPNHGFDMGKLHAAAMFFLPCQAKEREASFFRVYDEPSRKPLEVLNWIEIAARAEKEPNSPPSSIRAMRSNPISEDEKERRKRMIIKRWRTSNHADGHDYRGFYNFGLSLMGFCRCDEAEARDILKAEAIYSHNPENRLRQIDENIRGARLRRC
jgi:hypothetical protein